MRKSAIHMNNGYNISTKKNFNRLSVDGSKVLSSKRISLGTTAMSSLRNSYVKK